MEALLFSIVNFSFSSPASFTFSNFLGDRLWLMGAPNCRGPLVFELTLTNERYATGHLVFLLLTVIIHTGSINNYRLEQTLSPPWIFVDMHVKSQQESRNIFI